MNLSLKKIPGLAPESPPLKHVDLITGTFVTEGGKAQLFDLEQWPIMLFLKGFGFVSVEFSTNDIAILETWAHRLGTYQTSYLFDPENFRSEECQWNERNESGNHILIECIQASKKIKRDDLLTPVTVPPLEAPLGVDADMAKKFLDEVNQQSPQETIRRIHSILKEYEKDSKDLDPKIWTALVADIISIALESKLLEKAIELAENNSKAFANIWESDRTRVARIFASYDPKGTELFPWSRIFASLDNFTLVKIFESYLTTAGGSQIIKLMNYRIQNQSDEIIEICIKANESVQKLLLQWLTPHWREKHYDQLLIFLRQSSHDEAMLKLWLTSLLRSHPSRAFLDLEAWFPKPRLIGRKKVDPFFQKIILNVVSENPSAEVLQFVRKIKPSLSGKIADQAEKILSLHRKKN